LLDPGLARVPFAHGDQTRIHAGAVLLENRVFGRIEARLDSVVRVDGGGVEVVEGAGQLSGIDLLEAKLPGIFGDVERCGVDARDRIDSLTRDRAGQIDDGRIRAERRAQWQRIGHHAWDVSRPSAHSRCDRKAEHHFGLSAQTRDIRRHDRRDELRPRRAVALGDLPKTLRRFG